MLHGQEIVETRGSKAVRAKILSLSHAFFLLRKQTTLNSERDKIVSSSNLRTMQTSKRKSMIDTYRDVVRESLNFSQDRIQQNTL